MLLIFVYFFFRQYNLAIILTKQNKLFLKMKILTFVVPVFDNVLDFLDGNFRIRFRDVSV